MEQLLKTAQELVAELKRKNGVLDTALKAVSDREAQASILEASLNSRSVKLQEQEAAEVILAQAKAIREEAYKIGLKNEEAKAALQTAEATQRERFQSMKAEAQAILDQAGDVKGDRARLEAEKLNYRQQIMDEIKAKLG